MANIKVSEMTEATSFDDGDYAMIVQANQNKKITRETILGDIENNISTINTNIGDLSNLETSDKTSIVNSINELKNAEVCSTEEVKTNKIWIDGKPIYRKVINFGALPNNAQVNINHNISDVGLFINIFGVATRDTDKDTLPIPYVTFNANNSGGVIIYVNDTSIYITTSTNRSTYNAYIILEYTKSTD